MNTLADDIIDIIQDIADHLAIDLNADEELSEWFAAKNANRDLPELLPIGIASQAIAEIIAPKMGTVDDDILDQAMGEMSQEIGWQFPDHDVVLWTTDGTTAGDNLVVWFGNDRDHHMSALGQAEMS